MPTVSRFYGIVIQLYFNDKHVPHFHAIYAEHRALIAIEDGRLIAGRLPVRAYRLVIEWARAHREELNENWRRARDGEPLRKIKPLE